tara:strand:+ start:8240 stop:9040 length:801 start_codon:yes stop_codon:yes gene_type:complete
MSKKKTARKVAKKATTKKVFGPDVYQRDDHGLLKNQDYVFNEDGSIDWRSMIKPDFLYPNRDWFATRNKTVPDSTEGLRDNQLLIMLGGIKELAKMRGYSSVDFEVENISDGYVTAKCIIKWDGNYESCATIYTDVANASLDNTDSFASKFLETIACNRAFVRCVRNFLNIHIVGADEIDKSKGSKVSQSSSDQSFTVSAATTTPKGLLEKYLRDKHEVTNFDGFKDLLRLLWKEEKYVNEDVKDWGSFNDIPVKEVRKLIAVIAK